MPIYLSILIEENLYKLILSQSSVPFMYNDVISYFYKSLIKANNAVKNSNFNSAYILYAAQYLEQVSRTVRQHYILLYIFLSLYKVSCLLLSKI